MLRKLRQEDVQYIVEATEEDQPIEGNALVSGSDEVDAQYNAKLILRRAAGDVWAWAVVKVTARWKQFEGTYVLGGCTYADEADFRRCPYFSMMQDQSLENLQAAIQATYDSLSELVIDDTVALRRKVAEYEELLADDGK